MSWSLCDAIEGNKSLFYHRSTESQCVGLLPRPMVRKGKFEPKLFFLYSLNHLVKTSHFDRGVSVDHKTYLDGCIKPVVESLKKRKPKMGAKKMIWFHHNTPCSFEWIRNKLTFRWKYPYYWASAVFSWSCSFRFLAFWLYEAKFSWLSRSEKLNGSNNGHQSKIPENEWRKTFNKWIEKMELCVKYKRYCFEHNFSTSFAEFLFQILVSLL